TKPGLAIGVGEPAITPAPRRMMAQAISEIAKQLDASADVVITVSIAGGEEIAEKTFNPRLGIVGGLSVLGTTGVVIPYSCSAWVHAIRCSVDVARAGGYKHIAGSTGRTSEAAVRALHGLDQTQCVEMGDFAGALLKYLKSNPIDRLTIAGGFAKMSKLAAGDMDLHSSRSQVDIEALAGMAKDLGASPGLVERARRANSAGQILEMATSEELAIGDMIAKGARETVLATLSGGTEVDVAVFDRRGGLVGHA
ncbi:MAG: cobalt-precorrin-5B (C(1))-methyltransferase CbiD, partial [Rhodospirillales bacterium]